MGANELKAVPPSHKIKALHFTICEHKEWSVVVVVT